MLTDQSQAQKLFDVLFEPSDIVEVRLFPAKDCAFHEEHNPNGLRPQRRFYHSPGAVFLEWDWIEQHAEEGYNIYFGVNPRVRNGGKREDVRCARCLFVDIDDAESLEEVHKRIEGLPPYSAIVESGNGWHVYWRLVGQENDLDRWSGFQKGLIAHCKSDKSIHDPPRIMRMPGTVNQKDTRADFESDDVLYANVVEITGDRISEDIAQVFPKPPKQAKAMWDTPEGMQRIMEGECLALPRDVQDWLSGERPASVGERHAMLVKAAMAVIGNGWPQQEGLAAVRKAAERDGKDSYEIDSVFSFVLEKKIKGDLTPSPNNSPREYEPADDSKPEEIQKINSSEYTRPYFSNVVRQRDMMSDDKKEHDYYKPVDMIAEELRGATGGWPALAKGVMFYPTGNEEGPFRTINNPSQLFAYIYAKTSPRWVSNKDLLNIADRTWRSTISKQEFYEYLSQLEDDFTGIEILPHEPPLPGVWYAPIKLPEPSGKLDILLEKMNGETEIDNQLIRAMMATPFAGVPAGSRPMFVIRSRYGRGTGKTTTCDIAVKLAGLACDASASEDWDKIARKLVDENGLSGRIVRIDNVKGGRLSSAEFESAITSPVVAGHRMYKGSTRRANNLTWIMTANTPNLSTDFASRSVVINIGESKHSDTGFKAWLDSFLAQHRLDIIADLLLWLRGPRYEIDPANNGRFGYWTDAVLTRFENGDEIAQHVAQQRIAVDTERQDAEEWADHIAALIRSRLGEQADTDRCNVVIAHNVLHEYFEENGHTDLRTRGFKGELTKLAGNGPLKHLTYDRVNTAGPDRGKRGWRWCTDPECREFVILTTMSKYRSRVFDHEGGPNDLPM